MQTDSRAKLTFSLVEKVAMIDLTAINELTFV